MADDCRLELRVSVEWLARLDAIRGQVPRGTFVKQVVARLPPSAARVMEHGPLPAAAGVEEAEGAMVAGWKKGAPSASASSRPSAPSTLRESSARSAAMERQVRLNQAKGL